MSKKGETPATLAAALAATRRSFDGRSERARDTERRILESMRGTKRMPRVFWLVPLAAAFVVSAAFADEIGERLSVLASDWFSDSEGADVTQSSSVSSPTRSVPAPAAEPSAAPATSASVALALTPPSAPPPLASTSVSPVRPAPSSRAITEPVSELAVYKQAHRAHFVDHDYANALTGWERYLAVAPRGTFALEARYNRAIALYRLGRREAALEALRPFADGAYGAYRRDEARELIEELR